MAHQGLHTIIQQHLRDYFDAHEEGELPPPGLYQRMLATLEVPLLEEALRATRGNQIKTAQMLGINRNTLHKKLKQYGLLKMRATPVYARRRRAYIRG